MSDTELNPEERRRCPECAEWIMREARKCRFCGANVLTAEAERVAAAETTLFDGAPVPVYALEQWLVIIGTFGLAYLYFLGASRNVDFRITTQRICIERGILGKVLQTLDVFRIEHFELRRPLGMRLLGNAELHLVTSDPQFPQITIYGIPGIEKIAEELRISCQRERARRKVTTLVQA